MVIKNSLSYVLVFLLSLTLFSSALLLTPSASADTSVVDDVSIMVQVSCTLTSVGNNSHNATINPGTYVDNIGTTTLKVFCNDNGGFAIYAIGFTGDAYTGADHTKLIGANTNQKISTGTATGSNTNDPSNWAMKLTKVLNQSGENPVAYNPDNLTITNGYGSYSAVPDSYTKVASYSSTTDFTLGAKLETTYAAFMTSVQAADTYSGKVKYTLVHPASARAPVPVSENLYYAITGTANNYTLTISDSDITAGAVASGPVAIDGYTLDEYEWIPTTPWYPYANQIISVVVDSTVAPTSTSYWFAELRNCASWDLSGLKTDNVTNMSNMFDSAGENATTFSLDLSSWNTSNVTDMSYMFASAGRYTTTFSLDLSSWNTSNVTNMSSMFLNAGENATTWSTIIPPTNSGTTTGSINNTAYRLYGKTTSYYAFKQIIHNWYIVYHLPIIHPGCSLEIQWFSVRF